MAPTTSPETNSPGYLSQLMQFLMGRGVLGQAAGQPPTAPIQGPFSNGLANGLGAVGRGLGALTGNTPAAQQNNTSVQKAVDEYMKNKAATQAKVALPITKKNKAPKLKPNEILAAPKE